MKELLKLMQKRQLARMPFDTKHPIAKKDLLKILEAGRWAPTAHNMRNFEIIVVDNKRLLDSIANIKRPISEIFIRENYKQLSFSEKELLRKKTKLLAAMFPPPWRSPHFKLDKNKKIDSSEQRLFPVCPAMLVVVYDPVKRAPASHT